MKIIVILKRLKNKFKTSVNLLFRTIINRKNRKKLKNKNITLISSNCNGCLILHDLGLRFNSPFVNLFVCAEDYIKLLQNFSHYMSLELHIVNNHEFDYPVAALDDIMLHCVHYKSEEEVLRKWAERRARMDMLNCFIMFTECDGCSYEHLKAFDALPFENKVVFTNRRYEDIKSSFYISGFENNGFVGALYHYRGMNGKKYYDDFDYVAWFNGECIKERVK